MPSKKTYSISEVAAILGISDKTLRRWEAKGSINPLRTLGNQRRYSEIDIAILKQRLKKITPYLPAPSQSVSPFTKDDLIAKLGVSGQTVDRWQEMGRITPIATLGDIKQTVFVPKVEEEPVKTPPTPELLTPDSPLLTTDVPTPEFLPSEALAKDGPIPSTRGDKSPHWKRWLVPTALGAGLLIIFLLLFTRLNNQTPLPDESSQAFVENGTKGQHPASAGDIGYFLGGTITIGSNEGTLSSLDQYGNLNLNQGSAIINGDVSIGGQVNLIPHSQPEDPQMGSLYFDQSSKTLTYYDGSKWIYLDTNQTNSIISSLQSAYNDGGSIKTTSDDIAFTLTDTVGSDASFTVEIKGDTSQVNVSGPADESLLTIDPNLSYPIQISQPTQIAGNLVAPKLIDYQDQTYYLDPGSSITAINVNGDITTANDINFDGEATLTTSVNSDYVTFSKGVSIGNDDEYYFSANGTLNANNIYAHHDLITEHFYANGNITLGDGDGVVSFNDNLLSSAISLTSADTTFTSGDIAIVDAINTAYATALGAGTSVWTSVSGIIYPNTLTDSLAIGGSSASAPFFVTPAGDTTIDGSISLGDTAGDTIAFNGLASTTLNMNGNLITNIGDAATDFTSGGGLNIAGLLVPTSVTGFTLTGSITGSGSPDITGINTIGTTTLDLGTNTLTDTNLTGDWNFNTGSLTGIANVTTSGTTTFNPQTYTWPGGAGSTGYVLATNGSGGLSWADPSSISGSASYWLQSSGALLPKNATVDLLLGGVSTASAKFSVLNMNSGIPTASLSAGLAGGKYLNANGLLQTTNSQTFTN